MQQVDIFGETQALVAEPKPRDASAYAQSRLFEPQMEGQLTLEPERPAAKAGRAEQLPIAGATRGDVQRGYVR